MTTVIVDNYDSFSYNLYQAIGSIDPDVTVVRNDRVTVDELASMGADRIVLSPAPEGRRTPGSASTPSGSSAERYPYWGCAWGIRPSASRTERR